MKKILCIILILLACISCSKKDVPVISDQFITILWALGEPDLQVLTRDFTKETGIRVIVRKEQWSSFQDVFFAEMKKKGQTYDMVVGDSQWLGRCATEGFYVPLTKWINEKDITSKMTPASFAGYAEYPKGSKHYWAIPCKGDTMGFAYRKDLFEDPKERQDFKTKYGYDLDVPQTWHQLRDIAAFFNRPAEGHYGLMVWTSEQADGVTMGFDSLLWSWGADIGDEHYHVKGILNSPQGIEALEFYKSLLAYGPPEINDCFFDEANQAFTIGQVAMAMNFFGFVPSLYDKTVNPYADKTGFFAMPAGPKGRYVSLGGQGLSLIGYSKKKALCLQFMEWFARDDVQKKWAELSGTCSITILDSNEFLTATPYNKPFMESMKMVKDFWTVPEYAELLKTSQKYWHEYLTTDTHSAADTMYAIAHDWEAVFENAGYYRE